MTHQVLAAGGADWALDLPFTGKVAVDSYGDARKFLAELPADKKREVQIVAAGASGFRAGRSSASPPTRRPSRPPLEGNDVSGFGGRGRRADGLPDGRVERHLRPEDEGSPRRQDAARQHDPPARGQYSQTAYEGLGELVPVFEKELKATKKTDNSPTGSGRSPPPCWSSTATPSAT